MAITNGTETIHDFEPGKDHVEWKNYSGIASFDDLVSHITDTSSGALITFDSPNDPRRQRPSTDRPRCHIFESQQRFASFRKAGMRSGAGATVNQNYSARSSAVEPDL
ncbi:MAG TPA: hypothetical protein VL966_16600 [Alphaproteobacteria bacterium]|nr:hypothetical protein [Alphaproteobacteria bacterium]